MQANDCRQDRRDIMAAHCRHRQHRGTTSQLGGRQLIAHAGDRRGGVRGRQRVDLVHQDEERLALACSSVHDRQLVASEADAAGLRVHTIHDECHHLRLRNLLQGDGRGSINETARCACRAGSGRDARGAMVCGRETCRVHQMDQHARAVRTLCSWHVHLHGGGVAREAWHWAGQCPRLPAKSITRRHGCAQGVVACVAARDAPNDGVEKAGFADVGAAHQRDANGAWACSAGFDSCRLAGSGGGAAACISSTSGMRCLVLRHSVVQLRETVAGRCRDGGWRPESQRKHL